MKTEQEKKVSCEDFSHSMSGNRHMKSRLYPLADSLTETVFSLKENDGKEFTHKKSPSTILAYEDAISSHLNFQVRRSEILSRADHFRLLLFLSSTRDITVPSFAAKSTFMSLKQFRFYNLLENSCFPNICSTKWQHKNFKEVVGTLLLQFKKRNDLFRGPGKNQTHLKSYFHIVHLLVLVGSRYINYSIATHSNYL